MFKAYTTDKLNNFAQFLNLYWYYSTRLINSERMYAD